MTALKRAEATDDEMSIGKELETVSSEIVAAAMAMKVSSNAEYEEAAKFLVAMKTRIKQIKDYWAEPKKQAAAAHKTIVEREKDMLASFDSAVMILQNSMLAYRDAVEKARKEAEEEARRFKQEEAERLLDEAVKAEQSGDSFNAEAKVAMAEIVSDMKAVQTVVAPKAEGTSVRKTWKAKVIDPKLVPSYVGEVEVRTINLSALNKLAKMMNGEMKIPGIEFYVEQTLATRT